MSPVWSEPYSPILLSLRQTESAESRSIGLPHASPSSQHDTSTTQLAVQDASNRLRLPRHPGTIGTLQRSKMQVLLAASLVSVMIVAGITAMGWARTRTKRLKSEAKKKEEDESVDNEVEIVVEPTCQTPSSSLKKDLRRTPRQLDRAISKTDELSKRVAPAESVSGSTPPELANRRQYVRAVASRFESQARGIKKTASPPKPESPPKEAPAQAQQNSISPRKRERPSPPPAKKTFRNTSSRPNNLNSFLRQCSSNIDRATFAESSADPAAIPKLDFETRTSPESSNQCDSPQPERDPEPATKAEEPTDNNGNKKTRNGKGRRASPRMKTNQSNDCEVSAVVAPAAAVDAKIESKSSSPRISPPKHLGKLAQFQQMCPSNKARCAKF